MSLEGVVFKTEYHYKKDFINRSIVVIKHSSNQRRVQAHKNLIFRMMKDIVTKNISNYLNLLSGISNKERLPERDELVADCYLIFDKCLQKYKVKKKHNFYFYFNKSLSRNFFRDYQREMNSNNRVELTEAISTVSHSMRDNSEPDTTEILMDNFNFSTLEKRICRSRMLGQKTSEFLEKNTDVTNLQYSKCLKRIKEVLNFYKEKGQL